MSVLCCPICFEWVTGPGWPPEVPSRLKLLVDSVPQHINLWNQTNPATTPVHAALQGGLSSTSNWFLQECLLDLFNLSHVWPSTKWTKCWACPPAEEALASHWMSVTSQPGSASFCVQPVSELWVSVDTGSSFSFLKKKKKTCRTEQFTSQGFETFRHTASKQSGLVGSSW